MSIRVGLRPMGRILASVAVPPDMGYVLVMGSVGTELRPDWSLLDWLTAEGYTYDHYAWNDEVITAEFLGTHGIVYINRPHPRTNAFTAAEKAALQAHVANGAALVLLADTDDYYENCAKINSLSELWGFRFDHQLSGSIVAKYWEDLVVLYSSPNDVSAFVANNDSFPTLIDDPDVAIPVGWYGAHEGIVINAEAGGVLGMPYDAFLETDEGIENIMEWLVSPFARDTPTLAITIARAGYNWETRTGEVGRVETYPLDDVFGYLWVTDSWLGQSEKASWTFDFLTLENTTYYIKWKGILTAHPSYAGNAYFTISVSPDNSSWTQVYQEQLTPAAGADDEIALRTDEKTGNYRYIKAEIYSINAGMATHPSRLYVDAVWRD